MKPRSILYYLFIIGGGVTLGYWILRYGKDLESVSAIADNGSEGTAWEHFVEGVTANMVYPAAILLLQIITIILVARFFGILFRKIGQPSVIGEIVAGIVLGPSLLGHYFPEISAFLFPVESLANLGVVSQLGLVLFMFVVGMELDLKILKNQAHDAVVISHASIIFPFLLGMGLAYVIFQQTAPPDSSFLSYALFIGISMSITAFPVLARIVQERGMTKTRLGSIAITCAAADDITAWCLLAAVIAVVKAGSLASAGYTILFAVVYVVLMLRFVRPFLQRIGDLYSSKERMSKPVVGIFFLILLISAWTTETVGIHALFGAFMAGVIMPANVSFRNIFIEKVEDVSQVLLLPLFFVFTGLRTQIGLLNEPGLWQICIGVIIIAVVGKFLGSAVSAKFVGQNWHSSLTIGALMNTRGLMELVALNIGYDLGVLTAEMFAILVLMALVTTFMTGPALGFINHYFEPEKEVEERSIFMKNKYNILLSFANPNTGKILLRIANMLTKKSVDNSTISALHLSPGTELNPFNSEEYERDNFAALDRESQLLNRQYRPIFRGTDDIEEDIAQIANTDDYDLLLTGIGQSVYEGTLLGKIVGFTSKVMNPEKLYGTLTGKENIFVSDFFDDRTKNLLKTVRIPYGILIDRGLTENINRIVVPICSLNDSFLLVYIQKFIQNSGVHITLWDLHDTIKSSLALKEAVRSIDHAAPNHIEVRSGAIGDTTDLQSFELMLSSLETWRYLLQKNEQWLQDIPSALIWKA